MSTTSTIEWTDATWNPVTGCTKVSPGCDRCYAETFAERFRGVPGHHFEQGFDVVLRPERLDQPLKWKRPRRVFVNSMSDLFHDAVSDEFIARVFAVMAVTPRHTYQLLTKRHGRMRALLNSPDFRAQVYEHAGDIDPDGRIDPYRYAPDHLIPVEYIRPEYPNDDSDWWPLPTVWLGVSVEDQKRADLRIPALLDTPAAVRFLSCEPLLGPVDLHAKDSRTFEPQWLPPTAYGVNAPDARSGDGSPIGDIYASVYGPNIDWVIVGGESGHGARPLHPNWARSLRDQCTAAGVPFLFKQWGNHSPYVPIIADPSRPGGKAPDWNRRSVWVNSETGAVIENEDDVPDTGSWQAVYRVSKKAAGRQLDGRTWDEYPAVTR